MRFPLLVLTLGLAALLSACSGGEPDDDATLAGSWETQTVQSATYLTLSASQSVRRPDQPGTGGLVLTGDLTGTLRYFVGGATAGEAFVTDRALFSDETTVALRFGSGAPPANVRLTLLSGATLNLAGYDGAQPFTRTATYIEAHNARFVSPDDATFEVTVSGRLTFVLVPFTANQEGTLIDTTIPRADADVLTRTFGAAGAYTQVEDDLATATGTWVDLGGQQIRVLVGTETTDYGYSITGSTLTLTEGSTTACNAECQQQIALFYGVQEGTLVSFRNETVETLSRGAASPARPGSGAASRATPSASAGLAPGAPALPAWLVDAQR